MFVEKLQDELNNEKSVTENGAIGYRTTGKELLDMNFAISSMRGMSEEEIAKRFTKVYFENPKLAIKWLFYVRDIRGGVGERRLFRICFKELADINAAAVDKLIELVPEYGRWDDLWVLLDTPFKDKVVSYVKLRLDADDLNMLCGDGKRVSLLAKWMPSEKASSKETRRLAKLFTDSIYNGNNRAYRKKLSRLRKHLNVIEQKMSANEWNDIKYEAVPSRANLMYSDAFLKHDEERRAEYLKSLVNGETKINASTLFPHDIISKYKEDLWGRVRPFDATLEELWKALPDYVQGNSRTICVADGSGSMMCAIPGVAGVSALDVANSLAIYFAERCEGEFKDKYITFSMHPRLVNLSQGTSLRDKIRIALSHHEVANTNIEAVFDLILKTALDNDMKQDEIPNNILILSDMEFDHCAVGGNSDILFENIAAKYEKNGYRMPRLVFWNILSRTGTIPVKENELGVALASGFSPAVVNMVLSSELDPYKCLLEQLNSNRYEKVESAIKDIF